MPSLTVTKKTDVFCERDRRFESATSASESVSVGSRGRCRPKSRLWRQSGPGLGRELQCLDDLSPERWNEIARSGIRPLVYCQCQGEHVVVTLTDQEIDHPDSIRMEKLVDAKSGARSICLEILKPPSR